jgi:hypothetical protein
VSVVYSKQAGTSSAPSSASVAKSQSAGSTPSVSATPVPSQFKGAAGRVGGSFGVVCAIAVSAVAMLL